MKDTIIQPPIRACWLLTSRCNYSCKFCHRILGERELFFNEALDVLDSLIESGIKKITFSGGEPMLWGGTFDLIKAAKEKGVMTMMITNGSLLTPQLLRKYATVLDWITFSVDGSNEEINQKMTRDKGHFDRLVRFIEQIKNEDLPMMVKVNSVYARPNVGDLENLAQFVLKHEVVKRWKVFQFYPVRGMSLRYKEMFVVDEDLFLSETIKVKKMYPSLSEKNVFFATNSDMEHTYFTLSPEGNVYLSDGGKDYFMGDLKTQSVREIWQNKLYDRKKHATQAGWVLKFASEQATSKSKAINNLKRKAGILGGGVL